MPGDERRVSITTLRQAVAGSVSATSLRQVARDVGMSPSGLRKFLSSASPYSATRRKLERWYVRRGSAPDVHSALAALEVLVQDLPPAERIRGMERILKGLERSRTGRLPGWIKQLRSQLPEGGQEGINKAA